MVRPTLVASDTRPAGKRGVSWRPAWRFKGEVPDLVRPLLEGLPGPVVHACCGPSYIPGETLRVDLEHPSADLVIDAGDLDKHVERASAVFMDPPYCWDLPTRMRAACAAWRCLDLDGLLITHAPWIPRFKAGTLEQLHVRTGEQEFGWPLPPVMLSVWRKPVPWDPSRRDLELERRGKAIPKRPEAWMWDEPSRSLDERRSA